MYANRAISAKKYKLFYSNLIGAIDAEIVDFFHLKSKICSLVLGK